MEDNFYNDDFERFLKDTTDNFRMYPSKKVWHSLYNDLHPARRWPSLAISLFIIAAILFVGVTNNNSISKKQALVDQLIAGNIKTAADQETYQPGITTSLNSNTKNTIENYSSKTSVNVTKENKQKSAIAFNDFEEKTIDHISLIADHNNTNNDARKSTIAVSNTDEVILSANISTTNKEEGLRSVENATEIINNNVYPTPIVKIATQKRASDIAISNLAAETIIPVEKNETAANKNIADKINQADVKNNLSNLQNRDWVEDYAFHNKAITSSWKRNAAFQFYITPSVGFRKLYKNNELTQGATPNQSIVVTTNRTSRQALKDKITQSSAINLETGATFLYSISKRIRLKTGFQFNYTSYNVKANLLSHPIQTNLLLNDTRTGIAYLSPKSSIFANSLLDKNVSKLKNNTVQIAIPVGFDYKLAGRNKIQWYMGMNLQPTYISGGHLYALSADEKNYVEDASLLRKWNLNAAFETFVSYKTAGGITITAGPQARYQFLSTYDSRYTYTEKLYNFGLKIGMITQF